MKKTNWDNLAFWIITIVLISVMIYLFATGRAWK